MFENDDWIFEDTFDDVGGNEKETKKKSYYPWQNKEKTPSVKRRKVDNCEVLLAHNTFSQKSKLDTIANIQDNDLSSKNKNDVPRGDLLLEIFQKNTCQEILDLAKDVEKDPSGIQKKTQCFRSEMVATSKVFQHKESRGKSDESMTKVRFDKEVKLIRLFPGPAGLVSDVKSDNISAASYLNNVEELENKMSTKRQLKIKSQDGKNLCGEKAWKLLLNDLPNNFLQDYKISTLKDKANANHCDNTRVKFIAGVLDYVDYSHDDPFVILKDSTGSIEGTIHRDIPSTYPGVLEPNIVIFLCDVGLLKTTTYVITNKYHILVSLVNLLAIYSDKGRIVSTPLMESGVISHTLNSELNRINNCMSILEKSDYISGLQEMDESCNAFLQTISSVDYQGSIKDHESELAKNLLLHPTNGKYESPGEIFKNDKDCKVTNEIHKYLDHSMDMNDLDMNVFFTTDCNFTSLEGQNCRDHLLPSISQATKIQGCNSQMQNTKYLENTKKKLTITYPKQTKEQHLPQTLIKKYTDVKICDTHYSRENCFSSCNEALCRDSNLNVKFTLPAIKHNVENSKSLVSYFTDDKYDAYDSDDEILSQLDVDNIVDKRKEDG